tara:strand:- start:30 stop:461 length:432 start_codon:yes stop_codon:yes gene_type:complete
MVDYKSKYLEMKLKYINAKNKFKGGMYDTLDEDVDRIAEEEFFDIFDIKVKLINEFLELTWYGHNSGEFGEFTEAIDDFKKKLSCCYEPNYGRSGWYLNRLKIKENPNNIDFKKLAITVETMKNMGLQENPYGHKWDGRFNDQ